MTLALLIPVTAGGLEKGPWGQGWAWQALSRVGRAVPWVQHSHPLAPAAQPEMQGPPGRSLAPLPCQLLLLADAGCEGS